jgi:hypothetical protein
LSFKKVAMMKFDATIDSFAENPLYFENHIRIPEDVFQHMKSITEMKRIVCKINQLEPFHCAMLPHGNYHYILLNKVIIKNLNLPKGEKVSVIIEKDSNLYGLPMSDEMQEVLIADPEGNELFQRLTPGKKRTLIHLVNKVKNSSLKIEKSFVILDHLKNHRGVLDFRNLQEDFKNNRFKIR